MVPAHCGSVVSMAVLQCCTFMGFLPLTTNILVESLDLFGSVSPSTVKDRVLIFGQSAILLLGRMHTKVRMVKFFGHKIMSTF